MIKHLILLKNPKYDGCQLGLVSMVYSFFETKTSGGSTSGGAVKIKVISNQELAKEYY